MELPRKLAAILSADVKGYSRLMGDDEEATVKTITAYREVMAGRGHNLTRGKEIFPIEALHYTCRSSRGRQRCRWWRWWVWLKIIGPDVLGRDGRPVAQKGYGL